MKALPHFLILFVGFLIASVIPLAAISAWKIAWLAVINSAALAAYFSMRLPDDQLKDKYVMEKVTVETLIRSIPEGVVMTDLRGDVVHINPPAMKILGVREEEIGRSNRGVFELIRQEPLRFAVQNILKKRTTSEVVEVPSAESNGEGSRHYHTTVTMYSAPENKDFGVLILMRDIAGSRS